MKAIIKKIINYKSKPQAGFSLIEAMIALSVIITGVVSGLTLTSFNLTASFISETRLIAANLAREGLETVRSLRDSNWLAGRPWNEGILNAGFYRFTVNFNPANNLWLAVEQANDIESCDQCRLYLDNANDVYSHDSAGSLTAYQRLITMKEICWQPEITNEAVLSAGDTCLEYGQELIGWQLESRVIWHENSGDYSLSVIDKLYDWR